MTPKTAAWSAGVLLSLALLSLPALFTGGRNAAVRGDHPPRNDEHPCSSLALVYKGTLADDISLQQPTLADALAETNANRRHALLEKWAQSLEVNAMGKTLENIQALKVAGTIKTDACGAVLASWAKRDVAGAVSWFGQRAAADSLHQQARDLLAQNMAASDPLASLAWMEKSIPASSRGELYSPFFRAWTNTDPMATATFLARMTGSPGKTANAGAWSDLAGQVAAQWAASDLHGALNWVQSLPGGQARAHALEQISYKWTETDPRAAAAYAAGENNPQFATNVTLTWAKINLQATAEWVRDLPPNETGVAAATTLASVWTGSDPMAAATFVANLPPGDSRDKAAAEVVSLWATTAPAQAAKWVEQFEESTARDKAIAQLMDSWASDNAAQAAKWLQDLPETPSRDIAVNTFTTVVSRSDPGAAFQWAETISDQLTRNPLLESVARSWLQQDPAAARQGIAQSDLPGYLKARLLSASRQ